MHPLLSPTTLPRLHLDQPQDSPLRGIVLWFDAAKGFGFIAPEALPERTVFVEHSCIDQPGYRTLTEHQAVMFTFERDAHGAHATWVRPR